MADRIITVTSPSVVTNDTLAGYNNYSDIDGQLGTTMTPTEATNGHTVALSDGAVHEVTSKPVGTTNGEFTAVISNAVTVDLSAGTTYAVKTSAADGSYIAENAFRLGLDTFTIEYTITNVAAMENLKYVLNNSVTSNVDGFWGFWYDAGQGGLRAQICDSQGTIAGTRTAISDGDIIRMDRASGNFSWYINDTLVETLAVVGSFTNKQEKLTIGARTSTGDTPTNITIGALAFRGETWSFDEQTGITATGNLGTVLDFNIGTGSEADMWTSI